MHCSLRPTWICKLVYWRASILMDLAPAFLPEGDESRPGDASAVKGKLALDVVVKATVEYIEQSFKQLDQIKA